MYRIAKKPKNIGSIKNTGLRCHIKTCIYMKHSSVLILRRAEFHTVTEVKNITQNFMPKKFDFNPSMFGVCTTSGLAGCNSCRH